MEGLVKLNTGVKITKEDQVFVAARAGFLSPHFYGLPIYMVDPDLMDKVYPPRRRRFLDPRCVKEILKEIDRRMEKEESDTQTFDKNLWDRLEHCREIEYASYFVAVGVYLPLVSEEIRKVVKETTGKSIDYRRAIFVCPERIAKWVQEAQDHVPLLAKRWGFRFLFTKVVIHELAHAYMDGDRARTAAWERVIEESLANAFAYQSLVPAMGDIEKATFEYITSKQPMEYRGWRYFIKEEDGNPIRALEMTGLAWKKGISPSREMTSAIWWPGWIPPHQIEKLAKELRWVASPLRKQRMIKEMIIQGAFPFWPTLSMAILRALV